MADLLKERSVTRERQLDGEKAFAFMNAVLDHSGDILAFLDADKRPMICGKNITFEQIFRTPSDVCPVNDQDGNLIGFIVREKKARENDRDFLTGTVGRGRLQEEFRRRIDSYSSESELTLVFIDLDRFKPVNERFGHLVGDQVLFQFAVLLKNTFRSDDCVARYGGDEFVILCNCPVAVVKERINQFRHRLSELLIEVTYPDCHMNKEFITLSFSYGLTTIIPDDTFQNALKRADLELLRMKRSK